MSKKFIEANFSSKATVFPPFEGNKTAVVEGRVSVKKKEASNKSVFLLMNITDSNSTTFGQCIFKGNDLYNFLEAYAGNKVFECIAEGKFSESGTFKNFEVSNIEVKTDEDFTPDTPTDYAPQLRNSIHSIKNPLLNEIVMNIFKNKDFSAKMLAAPATECSAYNSTGGLIHLIVDTANMANTVAMAFNDNFGQDAFSVNRDLLMAGAILCNIGKVNSIKIDELGNVVKTEQGILDSDIALAREMVQTSISKALSNPKFENDEDLITDLIHMISSCRERLDYGALCVPRTKHAMILANVCSLVFTKAMFQTLENHSFGKRTAKSYDNGRTYLQIN